MKNPKFPSTAIPGHGHRNHHAAGVLERVIGAAHAKMKFAASANRAGLALGTHITRGGRISRIPGFVEQREIGRCRPSAKRSACSVSCSDNSIASGGRSSASLIDSAWPATDAVSNTPANNTRIKLFLLMSIDTNCHRAWMRSKFLLHMTGNYLFGDRAAVGAKVLSLSALLMPTYRRMRRRSNAIRSEFGPPGTHRRVPALGRHALPQFQPGATRRSRGGHAVDQRVHLRRLCGACPRHRCRQ